jgi:hypothetical protein
VKVLRHDWPSAELDPVRRLRIMASATHAVFADAVTAHTPEQVWSVLSDLEGELPRLIPDIRTARVRSAADGEAGRRELEVLAVGYLGQRARFDIALESGWCWMQSRFLLCGFAITAEEGHTRYAFLGGIRSSGLLRGTRLRQSPGQAYARWVTRRIERRVDLRVRECGSGGRESVDR